MLNSFAKRLVDLFVVLVHTGVEVGVRTYKATRHLTRRRVQAQKKFARTTQNRMNHAQTTNNTAKGHDAGHDENSLKPRRRPRPRGGKNKEWYAWLYRDVWKRLVVAGKVYHRRFAARRAVRSCNRFEGAKAKTRARACIISGIAAKHVL